MTAGQGDDMLRGPGRDTLTGGPGNDVFMTRRSGTRRSVAQLTAVDFNLKRHAAHRR